MDILVVAPFIIFSAFFIQALLGFGGGIIAIPLLSIIMPPAEAVTLVLLLQLLHGGVMLVINRRYVQWSFCKRLGFGLVLGGALGVFFLTTVPPSLMRIMLAILIIAYVIRMFIRSNQAKPTEDCKYSGPKKVILLSTLGGAIQGAFGMGGPVFVMLCQSYIVSHLQFRATVIGVLFFSNIFRLGFSAPAGLLNAQLMQVSLMLLPFLGGSIYLGQKLHHKINEQRFKQCVLALLLIVAVSLILKSFVSF